MMGQHLADQENLVHGLTGCSYWEAQSSPTRIIQEWKNATVLVETRSKMTAGLRGITIAKSRPAFANGESGRQFMRSRSTSQWMPS
jgi:hypothetical protein